MFEKFDGEDMTETDCAARRKHSFVMPDRVLDNEKVDAIVGAVCMTMSRWSDALGYVRISDDRISNHFRNLDELDREGVARAIDVLEREELIEIHEHDDGEGLYSLHDLQALNEIDGQKEE